MKKPKRIQLDGIVSLRIDEDDALWSVDLVISRAVRGRLVGYGNNQRFAAQELVAQLRHYADWIAHMHDQPVLDLPELSRIVALKTGKPFA